MPLKLGLLGCSNVAKKNLFTYLESSDHYDLEIIGSRSIGKASQWAKEYGSRNFGSYEDVINSGVDVVYNSLPISLHEYWSLEAMNKGINVICEKSATSSLSSAKKMLDSAALNKVRILEAFSFF